MCKREQDPAPSLWAVLVFAAVAEEGNRKLFQLLKSEVLTRKMPQGGAVRWEGALSETILTLWWVALESHRGVET